MMSFRTTGARGGSGVRRAAALALAVLSVLLFWFSPARAGDSVGFRIIVHPDNATSSISREFLSQIFLKTASRWGDEEAIHPVDQQPDSAVRRSFSESVLHRSVAAVKNYWQQRIFSGRGVPPPELESDEAVVRYVLQHRGAVGYVSLGGSIGKARVVAVE